MTEEEEEEKNTHIPNNFHGTSINMMCKCKIMKSMETNCQ